jgi:tetratricopeptide (TPR) repeat protein
MKRSAIIVVLCCFFLVAPLFSQGDFKKGISYYKQGQYLKAISEFEQLVKESPDYEAGYRVLGDCYLKTKDYQKAAEAFDRSLELKDGNFTSYFGAAVAEFNLGQYRKCAATLLRGEKYAKTPREKYRVYQLRGSAYFSMKRFDSAVADLEKAVSIQRGGAKETLQLGIAHYQLGNAPEATRYLEQAVALDPNSVEAKRFLSRVQYLEGLSAIERGNYEKATQVLQGFVGENPDDGEAWYNLGLAQLFGDDLAAAERSLKRSTQLLPNSWEAFDRLGYLYEVDKRYQDSLTNYRKAFQLNQDPKITESIERVEERVRRAGS